MLSNHPNVNDNSMPDISAKKLQLNHEKRLQELLTRHKEFEKNAIEDMKKRNASLKNDLKDLSIFLSENVNTLIELLHGTGELTALYYFPLIYVVSIQEQYLFLDTKVAYYQLFFEANKKTIVTTHFSSYKALITEIDETANLLERTLAKLNEVLEDCKKKQNCVFSLYNKFLEIDKKNNETYEKHSAVPEPATLNQIPHYAKELTTKRCWELINEDCRTSFSFVSGLFHKNKPTARFKINDDASFEPTYDGMDENTKRFANNSIVGARSAVAFFKQVEKRVNLAKPNPQINAGILCK